MSGPVTIRVDEVRTNGHGRAVQDLWSVVARHDTEARRAIEDCLAPGRSVLDQCEATARWDEARKAHARAWMRAARADFVPGARRPCCVCGEGRAITHAHHVFPLALQYRLGVPSPVHDSVWLCPNHHALIHAVIRAEICEDGSVSGPPVGKDEFDALNALSIRFLRAYKPVVIANHIADLGRAKQAESVGTP